MEKEFDVLIIFKIFKDHWIAILAIALILAMAVFSMCTLFVEEKYESNYKILIINTNDSTYFQQAIMNANEQLGMIYAQLSKSDDIISSIKDDLSNKYTEAVSESFIRNSISISSDTVGFLSYVVSTNDAELSEDIAKSASKIIPEVLERSGYGTKIEVINKPSKAVEKSNTMLFSIVAFIAGAFLSWLMFFIRLFFNTSIVTKDDLANYFTQPVLGEIPSWERE